MDDNLLCLQVTTWGSTKARFKYVDVPRYTHTHAYTPLHIDVNLYTYTEDACNNWSFRAEKRLLFHAFNVHNTGIFEFF